MPHSALLDQARQDFLFRSKTVWQDGRAFHSLRVLNPDRAFDLAVDCLQRAGLRLSPHSLKDDLFTAEA